MNRILGWLLAVAALSASAAAGVDPGSISGSVTNSAGIAQMGATVEMLAVGTGQHIVAYTDSVGHFSIAGLAPGNYDLKVSAPSFLPTVREDVTLAAGAAKVVNITLSTLFEAARMMPARKRSDDDADSWKWTLRSTANRPILRFDDGVPVVVEANQDDHGLKGSLAFIGGGAADGFGSASDMGTFFTLEQPVMNWGIVSFDGSLGYGAGTPDGILRTTFSTNGTGSSPHQLAFTMRRFAGPDLVIHRGSLQAFALSSANALQIGDFLELQYGGEFQTVQFMGRANAFRPYGIVDWRLGDNTVIEYRYTTTAPTTNASRSFDAASTELGDAAPRMTMIAGTPLMENAHHHEVSATQHYGDNLFQIAYFRDRVKDPALMGVGFIGMDTGDVLPDPYSGTFSYNGNEIEAQGVRFVYQRKLNNDMSASFDYAYGGALDLEHPGIGWDAIRTDVQPVWRHSVAAKFSGILPKWNTEWVVSYRWTSGASLTPVDMYNASFGQTDPYFNLFVRQPLPRLHLVPGRMEAMVDLRNLLAEGYVPVVGPDGHTLYLVQSARSIRGGVSFTF